MRNKICLLFFSLVCGIVSFVAYSKTGLQEEFSENWYTWEWEPCPCENRTIQVGYWNGSKADYPPQQENDWELFRGQYGLDYYDRLGPETYTYDCHSYVFRGSSGWLQGDWAEQYLIWENPAFVSQQMMLEEQEEDDCYYCGSPVLLKYLLKNVILDKEEEGRWIWFTNGHSCEYDFSGKCADLFLVTRSDKVYNMCGAYSCYGPPANPNKIIK